MQIGFSLHNNWGIEDVQDLIELASRAEASGGVGVGGVEPESNAMGSPYAERGPITDEAIAIL